MSGVSAPLNPTPLAIIIEKVWWCDVAGISSHLIPSPFYSLSALKNITSVVIS
jgi:hypothetical protein